MSRLLLLLNGVVYIGSDKGDMYALNAANGVQLWNYSTGSIGSYVISSATVVNGVVYIGSFIYNPAGVQSYIGSAYALNANNGEKLWNSLQVAEFIHLLLWWRSSVFRLRG